MAFVKTVGLMHAFEASAARSVYRSARSDKIDACTCVVTAFVMKAYVTRKKLNNSADGAVLLVTV